jgi:phosphatidylglycerophosphatase C
MSSAVVAAFDVDKTLTTRDCVVPFLRRCQPAAITLAKMVSDVSDFGRGLVRRDRDLIKTVATRAVMTGRNVADVEDLAKQYATEVVSGWLRPDTVARLRWHQSHHHHVVLVSASYELYLRHLGTALGVNAVIATRLVRNGLEFTGEIDGSNCRGNEKARRLGAWIAEHVGERNEVVIWAYGDSAGDQAMLALADHPVWVGREVLSPQGQG